MELGSCYNTLDGKKSVAKGESHIKMALPGFRARLYERRRDAERDAEQFGAEGRRVFFRPWGKQWKVEWEQTDEEVRANAERNKRTI